MRVCFPLRSFEWTTVAEEWRKNASGVFRLQFEAEVATLPHSLEPTKPSQTNSVVPVVFFIHHRYIVKFASLLYFFLIFFQCWKRGKGKGRRGNSSTAESRNTGILYTLVSPFPYTRRDTSHSRLNTSVYLCLFCLFVRFSKATARCFGSPDGKKGSR